MKATNSFVAGGAALYWAMNEAPPLTSDMDFWIPIPKSTKDDDAWVDLVRNYFNAIIPSMYAQIETVFDKFTPACNPYSEWQGAENRFIHSIVNFTTTGHYRCGKRKLQLIFVQVPDEKDAINVIPRSFDLNICQFVVSPNTSKSGLFECKHAVLPKEDADELIKHRVFDVIGTPTTGKQVVNTMSRISKYYTRGFSLATKTVVVKYEKIPVSVAGDVFYVKYKELLESSVTPPVKQFVKKM